MRIPAIVRKRARVHRPNLAAAVNEVMVVALESLCGLCGGRLGGGVVLSGEARYCSFECAQVARDRAVLGIAPVAG